MNLKEILNIEKEVVNQKVKDILEELSKITELQKISIRDLCDIYSSSIDNKILNFKKENHLEYVGGEFSVKIHNQEKFYLLSNIYFRDKNNKFSSINMKSDLFDINKLDKLSQKELIDNRELTFNIEP